MPLYADTDEYQQLQHQRTNLMYSCGNLRRGDDPEIMLIDQMLADGRWHHDNPGLAGSWRVAIRQRDGRLSPIEGSSIPRFETEAAAAAWIDGLTSFERAYLAPLFLETRRTIARNLAAAVLLGHEYSVFDGWWSGPENGWIDGTEAICGGHVTFPATHWMPLPPAPAPEPVQKLHELPAGDHRQFTVCDDCGKSNLSAIDAVWSDDGSSFCPSCRSSVATVPPEPATDTAGLVNEIREAVGSSRPNWHTDLLTKAADALDGKDREIAALRGKASDATSLINESAESEIRKLLKIAALADALRGLTDHAASYGDALPNGGEWGKCIASARAALKEAGE